MLLKLLSRREENIIWKGQKSVLHHLVQPWPHVRLIQMRTHLKLVYLNYLSYTPLGLENKDEGENEHNQCFR